MNFPYSQLEFRRGIPAIIVSGFHIQLIDPSSGAVISSTLNSPANVQQSLKKSGPIRCAALDNSNTHLATLADDKFLKVWKLDSLELLHERELPKRPTSAAFTVDGQTIVVADKFGDVFSYPLHPPPSNLVTNPPKVPPEEVEISEAAPAESPSAESSSPKKRKSKKQKRHENSPVPRDSLASHEATSNGTLVLGHTSLLTCFLLTSDGKFIITADRDEHIRVSWYPQGYCIESFCLGHTQFVSAICIPPAHPDILISGGGDAELKIWDWLSGKHKFDIPISEAVIPFVKVKVKPYKRGQVEERSVQAEEDKEDDGEGQDPLPSENENQAVLAVQQISTLSEFVLFSITGGTALFTVALPDKSSELSPSIHALDFGKPVLGFTVDPDCQVWVSVDLNWYENEDIDLGGKAVRLVKLSSDGQLADISSTSSSPLLDALNENCLIKASADDLASLNFYSSLTSLPKNTNEFDVNEDESGNVTPQAGIGIPKNIKTNTRKQTQGPGGGRKEQGKLKTQKAIAEKRKKLEGQAVEAGVEEDAPDSKRLKPEDPGTAGEDVH
ncbi:hypothetical protein GYMLUDRAFT_224619 [Collybiopsis luxurians FD-317 M1]|uniref:Uncharacterized protein n=1 Tax=Collybiopsis luxurians FD-317 M1 TaxID=944289 RepID=A0A0D0C0C5_9AGAR|nr:hypothetical protein GYMLUDRAFT_224619 [Collybiopsis luxurians FD-317 M1]